MRRCPWLSALTVAAGALIAASHPARPPETLPVWPTSHGIADRAEMVYLARPLPAAPRMTMIRNVATPTVTIYRPAHVRNSRAAIVILPGGAFRLLDWNAEGTMLAKRLAARGITALVLKYRLVPTPPDPVGFAAAMASLGQGRGDAAPSNLAEIFVDPETLTGRQIAREDATQSIRLVRQHARAWGIAPDRVGILGFSAGAFAAVDTVFDADAASRPNFVAAIYGGETGGKNLPTGAPPLFAAVAGNDELRLAPIVQGLARDWRAGGFPAELQVFATGGHGFGMLRQKLASDRWPLLFENWMTSLGYLPSRTR